MTELRPISLCNVAYKIISKVLCQRLKTLLPKLISETQSAFVSSRLISDNILIAQEMFHGLRTNKSCKGKHMVVKTDMSKAYDRVKWTFIEALMRKIGTTSGLRQGDLLSPYLFILFTEILITNLKKAEETKLITGLKQKRINGWTSKLLSRVGKEVLIKSVVSAIPTHVMSCFRLLKGVTNKLSSVVSNFWWSNNGQTRGMHWLAWKKLCRHKFDGGLGFRAIKDFNTALLAKQLWRLLDNPESLFARVFKGRYFRNTTPLEHIRYYSPSYGWQSIISARPLVHKGLIKRVGSGSSISAWNDPWIPATRPRSALCRCINYYPHFRESELIDPHISTWNLPLLEQLFDSTEVAIINGIPTTNITDGEAPIVFGPDTRKLLAFTWTVKCPPKIQHFLWQILTGCISVGAQLRSRGIQIDPICTRSGTHEETINHALFECPPAFQTWALSRIPTPPHIFPTDAVFTNLAHLFWHLPKDDTMLVYPWLIWSMGRGKQQNAVRDSDGFTTTEKQYNKYVMVFETDCSDVVKMVSNPMEWPAFSILLEEVDRCRRRFISCDIHHIPRTKNTKADKLASSARDLLHDVYYVNFVPPVWVSHPI
ncbi:unnamed protein product [Microthlaspi erraticum]|uniref:Reverse transcriptase domain-containing protein n=1 Tax=Microthlaspi erraticum TaxID=1685480 RepID=A0A6D2IWX1_9BRAS|nr:unnamed protein product [Microthlaspi erraticum]